MIRALSLCLIMLATTEAQAQSYTGSVHCTDEYALTTLSRMLKKADDATANPPGNTAILKDASTVRSATVIAKATTSLKGNDAWLFYHSGEALDVNVQKAAGDTDVNVLACTYAIAHGKGKTAAEMPPALFRAGMRQEKGKMIPAKQGWGDDGDRTFSVPRIPGYNPKEPWAGLDMHTMVLVMPTSYLKTFDYRISASIPAAAAGSSSSTKTRPKN